MNKFKFSLLGAMIALSFCHTAFALNQPTNIVNNGKNEIVFIENEVDKEYFVAASTLEPRFSGANVWTKYGETKQVSLGYMLVDSVSFSPNTNVDVWIESPQIQYPFIGIRCLISITGCPSTSYLPAAYTDETGVYKMKPIASTLIKRISFNSGMYEYIRNLPLNTQTSIIVNNCQTTLDYNPSKGQRCRDMSSGTWRRGRTNITKTGHLKLFDNRAFSELWVATDGTPSLANNTDACEVIAITGTGTKKQKEGIACKMVRYHFNGQPTAFNNLTYLSMVINKAALNNISIDNKDIRINAGGKGDWADWNIKSINNRMNRLIVSGDGYIQVLFTKAFFEKMLNAGASTSGQKGIFTFAINNTALPESGFYQFATNMNIEIIPREYGISIRSKNVNEQVKTGKIGRGEEAIDFNYIVTQSAPRKADTVKASVIGDSITKDTRNYCLFKSSDNSLKVPIPAYLSFTQANGSNSEQYSGCNASAKIELKDALWSETAWDVKQSGYFYSTDVKLTFPMNDSVSEVTVDGINWLGNVRAEGDVKVEATWIGVNKKK